MTRRPWLVAALLHTLLILGALLTLAPLAWMTPKCAPVLICPSPVC